MNIRSIIIVFSAIVAISCASHASIPGERRELDAAGTTSPSVTPSATRSVPTNLGSTSNHETPAIKKPLPKLALGLLCGGSLAVLLGVAGYFLYAYKRSEPDVVFMKSPLAAESDASASRRGSTVQPVTLDAVVEEPAVMSPFSPSKPGPDGVFSPSVRNQHNADQIIAAALDAVKGKHLTTEQMQELFPPPEKVGPVVIEKVLIERAMQSSAVSLPQHMRRLSQQDGRKGSPAASAITENMFSPVPSADGKPATFMYD